MQRNCLYLLHPSPAFVPGIESWIQEVRTVLSSETAWDNWDLHCTPYNSKNGFEVQPLYVRVLNKSGPVLLLKNVQAKPLGDLREKLGIHAVVMVREAIDSTALWEFMEEARRRHEAGEPLLPRKLVVAVLITRKLKKLHHWGGNAKGYLWSHDLAKGRGVDERFADVVDEVANDLLLHGILISKTSQGQKKYALNPARKAEAHDIADNGNFQDKSLSRLLMRDQRQEAASSLYLPHTAQAFTLRIGDSTHQCSSAAEIIAVAKACAEGTKYEVRVGFENDRLLTETFTEKRVLVQFLEAFK